MKSVVFTFGRMNPPTTGHQLLVNKLVAYARKIGAAPRVYLSHSVGAKDPLQYDKKISFARAAFGSLVKKSNARTVIEVLKSLEKEGFTHVTMFAGSDRVPEFTKLITKYNGKEYNFEKIEVQSAGERDPDADDVSGMSASKMRALAKDEKLPEFLRGAPNTLKTAQAKNMYNAVRRALLGEDVMDYAIDEKFISFIIESDDHEDEITFPSDSEIERAVSGTDLDLDDADALMLDLILGNEESEDVEQVHEAVRSFQQRQKLSQRMKGMSKRLARLRQIKAKQMPANQRLRMRARKAALMILRRRATGKKNLEYNSLSRSQRIAVDNALVNRFGKGLKGAVEKIAKRLIPAVRKNAQLNVAKARDVKESYIYEAEKSKEGTAKDRATDKIQAAKRGISVSDWEKTKADAAHDSPLNVNALKLNTLDTDPTLNDRVAQNPKQAHLHLNRKLMHYARNDEAYVHEGRKGEADARDAGDTNIMYQLRKVLLSRGNHEVEFSDKSKHKISVSDANKMLDKFNATRLPADKQAMTIQAGKSYASFRDVLTHGVKQDKKKISLGGKQFKEFYLGVGRTRTTAPFDYDEPPGTRRIAEVAKDEDRPTDPNKSRPLSQKLDLLLRLGLSDQEELQKYRRALRSSKKHALQSPQMREALASLLDKLIDLTTKDPATYSRVRYNVMNKEAVALLNKAEKSGVNVDIIFEVFARGYEQNEDINEAFGRVNSFIAGGKAVDLDSDLIESVPDLAKRYKDFVTGGGTPQTASRYKSHVNMLSKKTGQHPIEINKQVRKHVKQMKEVKEPTGGLKDACWSGYTAVGMKMKNGRKVPNCVPKEEVQYEGTSNADWIKDSAAVKASKDPKFINKMIDKWGHRGGAWLNHPALWPKTNKKSAVKERTEAVQNWTKNARFSKYDTISSRGSMKKSYVDRTVTPFKSDEKQRAADAMKDFLSKGGNVQKVPAGKKTIKSYVKPKKYMTPNQASRVTENDAPVNNSGVDSGKSNKKVFEQTSTHDATPLSKRVKRVKSFHAWHPKPVNEVQRRADVKVIKVRLPDGSVQYRKERIKAAVQHETYTGSEPASNNTADPANRFVGTNTIRQNYASVTPGQGSAAGEIAVASFAPEKVDYSSTLIKKTRTEVDQSKENMGQKHLSDIRKALGGIRESVELNESFSAGFELAPFARDYGIRVQSSFEHHPEVQEALDAQEDSIDEAIYQGREVPLGKPMKGDVKKSKVYVRDPSTGNVKKVNFGDKKLSIKKDQPARKRSYCARSSGQGNLTKKTSANYWSRRAWDC